jgi:hypothetical protein
MLEGARMNYRLIVMSGLVVLSTMSMSMNLSGRGEGDKKMVGNDFLVALHATERAKEISERDDIYGWLIGSWDLDAVIYLDDGTVRKSKGECRFGRVLEGRAIQDVWVMPPIADRAGDVALKPGDGFGTTIRYYDRNISAWRIIWIDPVNNRRADLVARREGNDIVQEGETSGQKIRWSFKNITSTSFRWLGEVLEPDGKTWRLRLQFQGRKKNL